MPSTLHIIGVPHTVADRDHLVCAFTAKILLFPEIIQPFGWYVVEYSNEGSQSRAHEHVVMLGRERMRQLSRRHSREDPHQLDVDNPPLNEAFQAALIRELKARTRPGDIVCHVWGPNVPAAEAVPHCHHVELAVGYDASPGLSFRIYESSAWMHYHYAKAGHGDGHNYKWVVPAFFDEDLWTPGTETGDAVLFHGRVTPRKGIDTVMEVARRMPDVPVHVYGPGDPSPWLERKPENLHFKGILFGDERIRVVQRARCVLTPTTYIEPFGCSGAEAQLCGVPQIATAFGAFQETVIDGVTGYRCHTLADWVEAIRASGDLDRARIAALARERYGKAAVGRQFDWVLRQLADLSGDGWYGTRSRKFEALARDRRPPARRPRIFLYVPYFGSLPNYFPLYLRSLARNADVLTVVLFTDIDLGDYDLPDNLVCIPMTLDALRGRLAAFLAQELGTAVAPEALLRTPYKIVDVKVLLPELFRALGARLGATEEDYVGWGDIDLIYGRFADFLPLEPDRDVIGGFHGHLTAFRNRPALRRIYREVPDLVALILSPEVHITDEIAFRQPFLDFVAAHALTMFYINRYFCDVVPACFVRLFRPNERDVEASFFDTYHPDRDIREVVCGEDGRLTVIETGGHARQAIYCHLQKRSMALRVREGAARYVIRRDGFDEA
ncbi:DUF6625 family protein [Methylobacterium sp. JK268]